MAAVAPAATVLAGPPVGAEVDLVAEAAAAAVAAEEAEEEVGDELKFSSEL